MGDRRVQYDNPDRREPGASVRRAMGTGRRAVAEAMLAAQRRTFVSDSYSVRASKVSQPLERELVARTLVVLDFISLSPFLRERSQHLGLWPPCSLTLLPRELGIAVLNSEQSLQLLRRRFTQLPHLARLRRGRLGLFGGLGRLVRDRGGRLLAVLGAHHCACAAQLKSRNLLST